jgi:GH25 family lysozyme M1 (1,4-beta-N-acetylmuramidase)
MALFGIDISYFQGAVDFEKAKASGVSFVIAKVSEGHTYLDPHYLSNKRAIPAAGLVPGAYHFLRPLNGSSIATQADWFCEWADPDAIHALDVEAAGPLDVKGFVAAYRKHYPTKTLLMYTGPALWAKVSKVPYDGAPFGPLWTAGYRPNAYVTATGSLQKQWATVTGNAALPWLGWNTWTIMQYTDHAVVPGVSGGVDGNAFGGTLSELKALAGRGGVDDSMSAADVEALKAWLKTDEFLNGVADALGERASYRDRDPYDPTKPLIYDRILNELYRRSDDAVNLTPMAIAAVSAAVATAPLDPAVLQEAITAAFQQAGASLTGEAARALLVDVLEKTHLSVLPVPPTT